MWQRSITGVTGSGTWCQSITEMLTTCLSFECRREHALLKSGSACFDLTRRNGEKLTPNIHPSRMVTHVSVTPQAAARFHCHTPPLNTDAGLHNKGRLMSRLNISSDWLTAKTFLCLKENIYTSSEQSTTTVLSLTPILKNFFVVL